MELNLSNNILWKDGEEKMKTLFNFLYGLLVIIAVTILEFIVTLPLGEPNEEKISQVINYELLLTALPAAFVTFIFAQMLKTKSKSEALVRSIIWTFVLGMWYLVVSIGNYGFMNTFGQIGIYVLLACSFSGPIIYGKVSHLE